MDQNKVLGSLENFDRRQFDKTKVWFWEIVRTAIEQSSYGFKFVHSFIATSIVVKVN